ncbi:hypothetical protein PWT90_00655 [Aphanocladium album]|nr:hypothetical protein PWT90_00655 [Aphanocladium album]
MPKSAQVSTAGRLKYADPKDLPSFPSAGLSENGAAASAAATLGWANQKSPEPWRPEKAASASAAALLAKDYKSAPRIEPTSNGVSSGASKAALLAVGSAGAALKQAPPAHDPKRSPHENWGNSAATQAFSAVRPSSSGPASGAAAAQAFSSNRNSTIEPTTQSSPGKSIEQRSLAAAKGAMASSRTETGRPSSMHKDNYTLEASAASSALNGAALAHRNSLIVKPNQGGASPVTNLGRSMYTSHPPVKPETDEERIHQTAVEMAKKMYQHQQKALDEKKEKDAQANEDSTPYAGTYLNLQDAAYKQAQERLAKLHNEHQQGRDVQEYYGNSSSPRRKFSMANKLRRRSDSDPDPDDKARSEKIRQQMSMFSTKLSQVDTEKRTRDREALLAAAQRNVKARLQGMDEKVYMETGRRNSSMLTDWELKAQQAAQARSDTRTENQGKVDIGGGKFMTQEEINAIAAKRLQPVLDDINEKAEMERERLAALKAQEDARREELERIRAEERAEKEEIRKAKEQEKAEEKAKRAEEKQEAKAKKDEEKAKKLQEKQELKSRKDQEKLEKAEQQRVAKEEKRKSKLGGAATAPTTEAHAPATRESQDVRPAGEAEDDDDSDDLLDTDDENEGHATTAAGATSHAHESTESAPRKSVEGSTSSQKSKSGMKGWIKKRFSVNKGKSDATEKDPSEKRRSFFGGSAKKPSNPSTASLENRSSSIRDVALAGKTEAEETADKAVDDTDKAPPLDIPELEAEEATSSAIEASKSVVTEPEPKSKAAGKAVEATDEHGVSPITTPFEDATDERSRTLEPPKRVEGEGRRSSSIARDSRFKEEM